MSSGGLAATRVAALVWLADKVRVLAPANLNGRPMQVDIAFPGQVAEMNHIWFEISDGPADHSRTRGGSTRRRHDDFGIVAHAMYADPQADPQTAMEAVAALIDTVDLVLKTPGHDPGLTVPGLQWARLGDIDGPSAAPSDSGWLATAQATVDLHSSKT